MPSSKLKDVAHQAHITSYMLALYCLSFPLLVTQAVRWLDWSLNPQDSNNAGRWTNNEVANITGARDGDVIIAVFFGTVWLLLLTAVIPWRIYRALKREHDLHTLHTATVHARLGFLYDKYTEKAYAYEVSPIAMSDCLLLIGAYFVRGPVFSHLSVPIFH